MIVVGIDPSLTSTGLALIDRDVDRVRAVWTRTVASEPSGVSVEARSDRMRVIQLEVEEFVPAGAFVVIEGPSHMSQGGARHERSGLWWAIVQAVLRRECRVVEVAPKTRAKYAAGSGNAGKAQVLDAMRRSWPLVPLVDHNQADALALAALGMRVVGFPVDESHSYRVEAVDVVRGEL